MSIRPAFDPAAVPVPPEPLELLRTSVKPEWIDYNGHMNVAYYVLVFDHGTDGLFGIIDIGAEYVKRTNMSAFVLETHVQYIREVAEGAPLKMTGQVLDADDKRIHLYSELFHADEGFLSATSELMLLHVDLGARGAAPFPPAVQARVDAIRTAHAGLPRPPAAGRVIGIRRRG
ncbi:MAG: thioesterase family protein [Alphaproteobacteria bacterium]